MTARKIPIEINNEIILLRQCVRRARICVINKLVRKSKRLRTYRGNEKLDEKNKNKAEKYIKEVLELKGIKHDEVSKFGIIHFENLQRILQNSETDDRTRVIVKVVRYKYLYEKITEFVKKFPNCKEYISLSGKKHLPRKKGKNSISKLEQNNSKQLPNKNVSNKGNIQVNLNTENNEQDVHVEEGRIKNNEESSMFVTKAVSKQAVVKKFVDIAEESSTLRIDDKCEENEEQQQQHCSTSLTVARSDDFFLCSDKTAAGVNTRILSPKEDLNITSRVDRTVLATTHKTNVKRDNFTYRGAQMKQSSKRQEANNKNVLYHRNNAKETNRVIKKEKQGFPRVKEVLAHEKFKQTKSLENESLHPSWAARRKLQDAMKQGFQGKKIRFEET